MCVVALTIASTLIGAAGAIAQGQQANAAAQAQARALEQQAEAERKAAGYEVMQQDRQNQLAQSAARAQVGASGVGLQGSPTEALLANVGQQQLDLEAIQYGSTIKQNNLRTQAEITRQQGKQAKTASFINAGSSLIQGATKLGSNPFK
jgi:hypothetical protein